MTRLSVFDAAREQPLREALRFEAESLTYADLADRVAGACDALRAEAVVQGARVALSASNHPSTVVVLLALIELGATVVLLHPRLTERERAVLIADADPARVLGDREVAVIAASSGAGAAGATVEGGLLLLYTSGTTGTPKGAVLSVASVEASARASEENLGWRDDDRWLVCLPLCHIGALSIVARCVMARRCVVLMRRFEAAEVLAAIAREAVTLVSVVPTMLRDLLDADDAGVMAAPRAVLVGGAAAPEALLARAVERGVRVLATYGLTEACSQVTTWRLARDGRARMCPGSGSALSGVEVEVVGDDENPLKPGEIGRIRVRGPTVMRGYRGREALHGAWFDTGDLGALDEGGSLWVSARRTDLIVTGGENVYPAEVEGVLESLDGVAGAVVFGVGDARWGQVVAAAIVLGGGRTEVDVVEERALREAMAERLAKHKWARRVCFVEALPMRASAKLDRAECARSFAPRVRPWR